MGKLDNTLIIYIDGDNGTSAEGTLVARSTSDRLQRHPDPEVPVAEQLKALRTTGARIRPTRIWRCMVVGVRHAVQVDQAGGVALRRHAPGPGHFMARSYHDVGGIRTQFHHVIDIVPTILEAGHPGAGQVNGIKQKPIEGVSMATPLTRRTPMRPRSATPSTLKWSATAASTTTAGSPPPRRPLRLGAGNGQADRPRTTTTGSSTTSPTTIRNTTTWQRKCLTS
jgi:hypothetical protein